ncbi:MAG: hypothetical protein M1837_002749 [Sclerophora amabilis]|nr:MAG: hypothetical protein M1837_002749 [Sclerophora amabilis]
MLSAITSVNRAISHERSEKSSIALLNDREKSLNDSDFRDLPSKGPTALNLPKHEHRHRERTERELQAHSQQTYSEHIDHDTLTQDIMAGRYVPPARRRAQDSADDTKRDEQESKHLTYSVEEISAHFDCLGKHGTLNSSTADPTLLSHFLLFAGAHPEWPFKIYCKSHLELLAPYGFDPTQETPGLETSIPLFVQTERSQGGKFRFDGYYRVSSVEYFEPRSAELISLLQAKFTQRVGGQKVTKERQAERWDASLRMRWAVVTVERDESREGEPCPAIKEASKSVNEMLEDLRLHDRESSSSPRQSRDSAPEAAKQRRSFAERNRSSDDDDIGPRPPSLLQNNKSPSSFHKPPGRTAFDHTPSTTPSIDFEPSRLDTSSSPTKAYPESLFLPRRSGRPSSNTSLTTLDRADNALNENLIAASASDFGSSVPGGPAEIVDAEHGDSLAESETWSLLSTGPVGKEWTVVLETSDKEI